MCRLARLTRRITTEILVWRGIAVLVSYEAYWQGLRPAGFERGFGHLGLQAFAPVGAPSPQADDGYHSEFLLCGAVEAEGGPLACATAWLDGMAEDLSWRVAVARWEGRGGDCVA